MSVNSPEPDVQSFPPGTVTLADLERTHSGSVILHPAPTSDPNDPLNWSFLRKTVNFGIVCYYVATTFVVISIVTVAFSSYIQQFGWSYNTLNQALAMSCAGLATGCMIFIPLVYRYGRRPIYILIILLQFAGAVWYANVKSTAEFLIASVVLGLGGAISETIVFVTINDLFFVHQRATMTGIFLLMQATGVFIGPVIAGYVVQDLGLKWMWYMCAIFIGANIIVTLLFFEETKYVPTLVGENNNSALEVSTRACNEDTKVSAPAMTAGSIQIDTQIPLKTYAQRMAIITKTETPIKIHYYLPIYAFCTIPAVAFTSLACGFLLCLFSILGSTVSFYMSAPPYNFKPSSIGLMSLAPFIGCTVGTIFGGPLNDKFTIWCAKRNGEIFEPEMRLYVSIPAAVLSVGGLLVFGMGLSFAKPWAMIAVGFGMYGCGFTIISDSTLTYLSDSYIDIVGNALVSVTFFRNIIALAILFALTPWIDAVGLRNLYIMIVCIATLVFSLVIPMIMFGKKLRYKTIKQYNKLASHQPVLRA